jgi:hypothetical protein
MRRARGIALAAAAFATGVGLLVHEVEARASATEVEVLSLGDRIRLDRADVGCRVTRLAGHGKHVFLDCRRAGTLRGTYGAYFGDERVLVVRFLDSGTARVVYSARHEGSAKTCG